MCQGWETWVLSTLGMVMTAFVAPPGQGWTLHHLPSVCSEPYSALLLAWWKTRNALSAASDGSFISLKRNLEDFPGYARVPLTSEDMAVLRDYE